MRKFNYTALKYMKWDSETVGYIAAIHEMKGRQNLYLKQSPEGLERLVEIAKVQSTESSNEIEGIRTTNTRLKQLVSKKTTPQNRDEQEIAALCPSISTSSVESSLKKLARNGEITKHGAGRSTFYTRNV